MFCHLCASWSTIKHRLVAPIWEFSPHPNFTLLLSFVFWPVNYQTYGKWSPGHPDHLPSGLWSGNFQLGFCSFYDNKKSWLPNFMYSFDSCWISSPLKVFQFLFLSKFVSREVFAHPKSLLIKFWCISLSSWVASQKHIWKMLSCCPSFFLFVSLSFPFNFFLKC